MKLLLAVVVCVVIVGVWFAFAGKSRAVEDGRREINEQAFANMRAKTKWNLSGDMLWGFFFTNPTRDPLVPVGTELEKKGYRLVDIYQDDEKINWWLHVEMVEVHSVDSLTKREYDLIELAERFGLGSYDGWDVGPAEKQANKRVEATSGTRPEI